MNSRASICRPSTTRQTVRGVASRRPMGPHRSTQNKVETTMATGDSPVCWPYSTGSMTWPARGSATMNRAAVGSTMLQPGSTAAASTMGKKAAMIDPTNGTKRMSPARMPHSTAFGTPMSQSPTPMTESEGSVEDGLHQEKAAQSCGCVVQRRRAALEIACSARRRKRSRMSSRCSRMKIRKSMASAVVASGARRGRTTLAIIQGPSARAAAPPPAGVFGPVLSWWARRTW